jgi:NitT/TauT family transport system substrate-binding protein
MGGSIEIASGAYSNTLTMAAKGQKLVAFANQVRCPGFSLVISSKRSATFHALGDLKGMRVGVSAPGSSSHMVLDYLLKKGGLQDADVSVIGVGSSAGAMAAVSSGQIDAMLGNEPIDTMLVDAKDAIIFTSMRSVPESEKVFGGTYTEASFYTTAAFLAKNPKTIQALANAVVKTERWLQTATAEQVAAAVPEEQLLGNKAVFIEAFNNMRSCLSPDGIISRSSAETVLGILSAFDTDVQDAKIPVEQTYDNRFVQNAAAAFH